MDIYISIPTKSYNTRTLVMVEKPQKPNTVNAEWKNTLPSLTVKSLQTRPLAEIIFLRERCDKKYYTYTIPYQYNIPYRFNFMMLQKH